MNPALPHLCKESSTGETIYYTWFTAMHTRVDLLFAANEAESFFSDISLKTFHEIASIEKLANAFDSESELSFVNSHAYADSIALSPELYKILRTALDYNRKTLGLFDITTDSESYDDNCIHCVKLDESMHIRFTRPGIKVNLSGFLKGYALDRIRCLVADTPMGGALINMGNSSIMCLGSRDEGVPWKIPCGDEKMKEVVLQDECLTTSGNDTAGRNHIINPLNGKSIIGKRATSVITRSGTLGEVLSTAFFIADAPTREKLMDQFNVRGVIDSAPPY